MGFMSSRQQEGSEASKRRNVDHLNDGLFSGDLLERISTKTGHESEMKYD